MKKDHFILYFAFILLLMNPVSGFSQDDDDLEEPEGFQGVKGIHGGFYLGAFFANKYTASLYDGYGFDVNGIKNPFLNSYMYQKIVNEYGYNNGHTDYIAELLDVDPGPGTWFFTEDDMPGDLKYKPAFLLGLHLNYGFSKREAILFNFNFAQVSVTGNFTIETVRPPGQNQYYETIHNFPLAGKEQRLQMQLGYSRVFGNHKVMNFFAEAGFCVNYARLLQYYIEIYELHIDFDSFNNLYGYTYQTPEVYQGWGFGVFGGGGLHFRLSAKYNAQLLYTPSYETVNININPTPKLQQSIGIRIFYTL